MYRLTDDIARRRLLYSSPLIGTPHVLLIDLPPASRGAGLLLGRYYAILPETEHELQEVERFLTEPRSGPVRPDLLDLRPSAIQASHILIVRYDPPIARWPWLSVCRWPTNAAIGGADASQVMSRGCYTFEAFEDAAGLARYEAALLSSLKERCDVEVRFLAAGQAGPVGRA